MKTRLLWAAVVLAACIGFYFAMVKPAVFPEPKKLTIEDLKKLRPAAPPPPQLPQPVVPDVVVAMPALPPVPLPAVRPPPTRSISSDQIVPIQDGTTIDFSYGGPQIRNQGKDAEELDKALKEIAEAVKDRVISSEKK